MATSIAERRGKHSVRENQSPKSTDVDRLFLEYGGMQVSQKQCRFMAAFHKIGTFCKLRRARL